MEAKKVILEPETRRIALGMEARFTSDGKLMPLAVLLCGKRYEISRIIGIRSRCPRSVGCVAPLEFTVEIDGTIREIYYEYDSNTWFSVR